ncbi:hypothetical protein J4H65_14495 [Vibrio alginolyticus]|uniref:hypothetical protein n=1 Tax=Vibrio alginolyticus TaxID=663 RepID=UPI001BD21481|nr:hypothetical protein [Vibrio alginolyticus]MBT0076502.1 hypothetical protein [Vibrio alginolyticus]
MITLFYFDMEMFQDENFNQANVSDSIINLWSKYGCLAFCEKDKKEILDAAKMLPPKIFNKWNVALANYIKTPIKLNPSKLSELGNYEKVNNELSALGIRTGIVPSEYLELFEEGDNSKVNVEIIDPQNIFESVNFRKSEQFSFRDISNNDRIDDIWRDSFKSLSLYSKKITIIDRYLIKGVLEDFSENKETAIEFFSKFLSLNDRNYVVNIYSACDFNGVATKSGDVKKYIDDVLSNKRYIISGQIKINIFLCKNNVFSSVAHDRMMVFERHAIQIGNGMDIFRFKKMINSQLNIKDKSFTKFNEILSTLSVNVEKGLEFKIGY